MFFTSNTISVQHSPSAPGEDERVLSVREGTGELLIAVLDGCGGTGGKQYPEADNWSGARLASHEVGRELQRWFADPKRLPICKINASAQAKMLEEDLTLSLKEQASHLTSSSIVISRMSLTMPTTLAAVIAESTKQSLVLRYFWAGNTRGYLFLAGGLKQVTYDDTVGNLDPFDDLIKDGVLCNVVNATRDFSIHVKDVTVTEPCMILAASDGCFSCFRSPVELEGLLLKTMMQAASLAAWESALRDVFKAIGEDDCTLQLAILGFQTYAAVKQAYAARWDEYQREYEKPLRECAGKSDESEALYTLWCKYKDGYIMR